MKNKNAVSRRARREGTKTKTARIKNVEAYYKRLRGGKNRHNREWLDFMKEHDVDMQGRKLEDVEREKFEAELVERMLQNPLVSEL